MYETIKQTLKNLTLAAMFLAAGLVLPFVTGQIPQIGSMLLPMHLPVLMCGLVCGWKYGLVVGFILPLMRSVLFGMPPMFPTAVAMAFELAAYGLISGLLRSRLPKTLAMLYLSLVSAMLLGRLVWGVACVPLYGLASKSFGFQLFITNGFVNAIPGVILQLIAVPIIVRTLEKAKLAG